MIATQPNRTQMPIVSEYSVGCNTDWSILLSAFCSAAQRAKRRNTTKLVFNILRRYHCDEKTAMRIKRDFVWRKFQTISGRICGAGKQALLRRNADNHYEKSQASEVWLSRNHSDKLLLSGGQALFWPIWSFEPHHLQLVAVSFVQIVNNRANRVLSFWWIFNNNSGYIIVHGLFA